MDKNKIVAFASAINSVLIYYQLLIRLI